MGHFYSQGFTRAWAFGRSRIAAMRILPGVLIPLLVVAGASSTGPELRKLYGEPDVERFVVEPGVTVNV